MIYATNTPVVPTNGAVYPVYSNGIPYVVLGTPVTATFSIGTLPPAIMPLATCSGITFWPTNGGSAALTARGISSHNNVVLITVNSNVVFQSNPTTVAGGLWRLSGRIEMDASNNLTTAISMSGAGGDSVQFTTLTNQSSTNFTFAIGPNTVLADTNLTLTAVSLVGNQGVAGVQGDFEWPTASSGGGGLTDFQITNTVTLPAGSNAYVTHTGTAGGIAYYVVGVPKGDGNTNNYNTTNIITAYNFTNQWLSSVEVKTYGTNFAFWGSSNYLARVNGIYRNFLNLGNDGGNPPAAVAGALLASFNGTNGWFVLTNGFKTTNYITVVETNAPGLVQPGGASLSTVDHWELLDRTNSGFGQHYRFENPINPNDPATKAYADLMFANAFNNNWSSYTSNGFFHFVYSYQNVTIADFASSTVWIPINTGGMDGTGTNFLMTIYATNLTAGYQIQSSTNLALVAGFTRSRITPWRRIPVWRRSPFPLTLPRICASSEPSPAAAARRRSTCRLGCLTLRL